MNEPLTPIAITKNLAYIPAMYLGLSVENYSILAMLMILDLITGIVRAGVIHGWRSVTSRIATFGILTKLTMILIPLVIALAAKGVGMNLLVVAKMALGTMILSEAYSVLGNIQAIRIRKDIKEFDAINLLLTKVRSILEQALKVKK